MRGRGACLVEKLLGVDGHKVHLNLSRGCRLVFVTGKRCTRVPLSIITAAR